MSYGSKKEERPVLSTIKTFLKRWVSPGIRSFAKRVLRKGSFDEIELVYELLSHGKHATVMVDVGAHHGGSLERFAAKGWKVYAFEPDPQNRVVLNKLCARYPNVQIDPRAVSNQNGMTLPFYTSKVSTGISSLLAFHESHEKSLFVDTVTLDAFFEERNIQDVGFMKIDTEGYDLHVLQGLPWDRVQPDAILCEFEDSKTESLGYDFHELANFLSDKKYSLLISEWYPVAKYGGKHRWRRFSAYPCDLIDPKAWGNIIAVKDKDLAESLYTLSNIYSGRFV